MKPRPLIRRFQSGDYARALHLRNCIESHHPVTEEEWRDNDACSNPKVRWGRLLAEVDGHALGLAKYSQSVGNCHPRQFRVWVGVAPGHRRQGIGRALFDALLEELAPLSPVQLLTEARAERPEAGRFIEQRGFVERMREWESRLDPHNADLSGLPALRARLSGQGIELATLAALRERDPDWARKLHALRSIVNRDIPAVSAPTEVEFEHWRDHLLNRSSVLAEGWFIAVHRGTPVGESCLYRPLGADFLGTDVTGVLRDYRRRGIALALKLCAIEYARSAGVAEIRTANASTNEAMLSLNMRLGFRRGTATIYYTREETLAAPRSG